MHWKTLAALAALVLYAAGCGREKAAEDHGSEEHGHEHHDAPHGGGLLELGAHDAHLEIMHDHDGGNMTIWVLGADAKTEIPVAKPEVLIAHEGKPVPVDLVAVNAGADGKASQWKGSHPGLKADPWDGRIRVRIGDKDYSSALEGEPHDH